MPQTDEVTIRPLRPEDEALWRDLWHGYLTFYKTQLPESVYDATFARLTSDDVPDMQGMVAVVDGVPVGLVNYIFHRHCWRTGDVCYLQDLYATPAMRGRGLGRKLIEAVYTAADAAGVSQVYWMTQADNHTARQLYDRVGTLTDFIKYQRPA